MISVNLSASCGATRCHITWVSEKPCSSSNGGPLPPTRAKMRPDEVLIHSEPKPGKRSARSGMRRLLRQRRLLLQTLFAVAAGTSQVYAIAQAPPARSQRKCHVDRFRDPRRSKGNPRKGPQVGARRVHSRREGTRLQAA